MLEITHLVIDAEADAPLADVLAEQRRRPQQIEHDPPARHLRVMVAAAVIAPRVAVLVGDMRRRQRADEDVGAGDGHDCLYAASADWPELLFEFHSHCHNRVGPRRRHLLEPDATH